MQWDNYWHPKNVKILNYKYSNNTLSINAEMIATQAACPSCTTLSQKVHSHYDRTISDLPCFGSFCHVRLGCRRFFCTNPQCNQQVFCERLATTRAYARKTDRLIASLHHFGFSLAANSAAKLCKYIGMKVSPSTLDRFTRAYQHNDFTPPRVLGVDDWALRKRDTYGTLLVDLEKQQVIDLLEGRDAQTLATWLKQHPSVEIISRDRSGEYALAVSKGAPQAVEVTDRWHLLKNLREMIERYFQSNSKIIKQAYENTLSRWSQIDIPKPSLSSISLATKQQGRQQHIKRFEQVHALFQEGLSKSKIARQLAMSRGTVIKYLSLDCYPERQGKSTLGGLKPYVTFINQRFIEGCHNINQLWRDIQAQGYQGKRAMVKRYVQYLKRLTKEQLLVLTCVSFRSPSPKSLSYDMLKPSTELKEDTVEFLVELRKVDEDFKYFESACITFNEMFKQRSAELFLSWLEQALGSSITQLRQFALKLRNDQEAIHNALKYPWSNGQLEGQVNRLKTIKRIMYGRANFDLLRAKVLYQAN